MRRLKPIAAIAAAIVAPAAAAASTIVFSTPAALIPARVPTQLSPIRALNGQWFLVALEPTDQGVSAYTVPQHGQVVEQSTAFSGSQPVRFTLADLDNDGDLDPIAVTPSTNRVTILENNLPASVDFRFTQFIPGKPVDVDAADFNNDGMVDLVAACESEGGVRIATRTQTGVYTHGPLIPTGGFTTAVVAADLNGDGKPDIAAANFTSATVSVLWNTTPSGPATTPTFSAPEQLSTSVGPTDIMAVDTDLDGDLDLAGLLSLSGLAFTFENLGPGLIANRTLFPAGAAPTNLSSADVNRDAYPDLIAGTTANTNAFSIFVNNQGQGYTRLTVPISFKPQSVAAIDFDSDGLQDLVAADGQERLMATFINQTDPVLDGCLGDTDDDLRVGLEDLLQVLADFSDSGPLPGDIDGNNTVNLADLLVVLSTFGQACGED